MSLPHKSCQLLIALSCAGFIAVPAGHTADSESPGLEWGSWKSLDSGFAARPRQLLRPQPQVQ